MSKTRKFNYIYQNYDGHREATFAVKDGVFTKVSVEEPRGAGYVFLREYHDTMDSVINELIDIVADGKTLPEDCEFIQSLLKALDADAFIIHRLPHYIGERKEARRKETDEEIKRLRKELDEALNRRFVELA